MDVRFIYPDMTAEEFLAAVEDLNDGIRDRNMLSFIPRITAAVFSAVMYFTTFIVLFFSWKVVVFLITGRDIYTILTGLFSFLLLIPSLFSLRKKAVPYIKIALLKLARLRDYEEGFTVKELADRDDESKKVADDLKFYRFCDEIRGRKLQDTTVSYDGDDCEVDISYWDESTGSSLIRRIRLPARVTNNTDGITVDFEQRVVYLPAEGGFI